MHFLAASVTGLFEALICELIHRLFIIVALIYLIFICVSPPRLGWRGMSQSFAVLTVLCVASVYWALIANDAAPAGISLSFLRYLPVAPSGFLICLGATYLSPIVHRKLGR